MFIFKSQLLCVVKYWIREWQCNEVNFLNSFSSLLNVAIIKIFISDLLCLLIFSSFWSSFDTKFYKFWVFMLSFEFFLVFSFVSFIKKTYLAMIDIVLLCFVVYYVLKKIKLAKYVKTLNYLIYHKLIIFNIFRILLIYRSSFVLSTYNISNAISPTNLQFFMDGKSGQFLVVFTIYYCIYYFRLSSCLSVLYAEHYFSFS